VTNISWFGAIAAVAKVAFNILMKKKMYYLRTILFVLAVFLGNGCFGGVQHED